MTQIAGLGMGNAAVQTGKTAPGEPSKEAYEQFASIMSQSAQGNLNLGTGSNAADALGVQNRSVKADATDQKYAAFRNNSRQIDQAARKDTTAVDPALAEKVQTLGKDVKDAVQETMNVSDEELTRAMELLGLSDMDLLQPQNLMQLVGQLTGSDDVSALLTNDGVQQLMQDVTELFSDFRQQNGIGDTEFTDLLAQLSAQVDELEQLVKDQLNIADDPQTGAQTDLLAETMGQDEIPADLQIAQDEKQTGIFSAVLNRADEQTAGVQTTAQPESVQNVDETVVPAQMQTEDATAQMTGEDTGSMTDSGADTQTDHGFDDQVDLTGETSNILFRDQTTPNAEPVMQASEVPQADPMIRYESLMNQMEGLARAFASSEGTTLQMQLNPENLGRLVLTVTEKHGNVTAQIAATNEQVKEALQTQMVELHSTLQAQGIKVEAVEVTVATHEFEQNLDGNASANAQMQEQSDPQSGNGQENSRRNLDRSMLEMEGIGGHLTEEESLAAQLMRDNGGSVDYTA